MTEQTTWWTSWSPWCFFCVTLRNIWDLYYIVLHCQTVLLCQADVIFHCWINWWNNGVWSEKTSPIIASVKSLTSKAAVFWLWFFSSSTPQLPSPRPSLSPNQLPSSRPSPNQLPLSRPSPTQLSSSRPSPNDLSSSTPLPHAKRTPAASPSMAELNFITSPNLSSYGWPADLSTLVGTEMSFQVVEYSPPGDLWVRINPLPGRETVPLVRLSLTDRYRLTPEPRPSRSVQNSFVSVSIICVGPVQSSFISISSNRSQGQFISSFNSIFSNLSQGQFRGHPCLSYVNHLWE